MNMYAHRCPGTAEAREMDDFSVTRSGCTRLNRNHKSCGNGCSRCLGNAKPQRLSFFVVVRALVLALASAPALAPSCAPAVISQQHDPDPKNQVEQNIRKTRCVSRVTNERLSC